MTHFPETTETTDLRSIVERSNGILRHGTISDGTTDAAGFPILRPATREELDRVHRVGNVALAELETRGERAPTDVGWLR